MTPTTRLRFIQAGAWSLGGACMLLIGVTIYDYLVPAYVDPLSIPIWVKPLSVIGGLVAGGGFAFAIESICRQWAGLPRKPKHTKSSSLEKPWWRA